MIAELIPKVAQMTREEEKPFYPRPSSAGPERCIRQMVYHGLNVPREPLPGRAVVIFSDSSFHEDLTADWIRQTAFKLHSEQMEVTCREPMTKGHIDGIITDVLGIDRLWEHKALNHFTFNRYWGGELPLDNLAQCAVYIDGIQTHDNPDLSEGLLLIKNKNTAQYIDYEIEYDRNVDCLTVLKCTHSNEEQRIINQPIHDIVQNACNKFYQVLGFIEKKTLPKRQYHINDDWQCEYCGWAKTCWEGYEKEFNELATETDLSNEIADTVRYYKELGAQKSDIEKEYKALSKKVKDIMKDAGAREGRAGEYRVKLNLQKNDRIDKTLLTDKEREKATVKGFKEVLYVSKIKEISNG